MKAFLHSLFREHKRQKLTMLLFLFIAVVAVCVGIFSFFSGTDSVSNRMTGKSGSVILLEPEWDNKGQYKAKAAEPGMQIEKNPYAVNDGQVDIYVRLVMTVELGDFVSKNTKYDADFHYDDATRMNAILDKIMLSDVTSFLNEARTETNNSDYVMRTNNEKTVFYFYFTAGDKEGTDDLMRIVKPNRSTSELFQFVDIPVYKDDYFGVFDQKYDIKIEAQAIPAGNYPDGLTVDEAVTAFDNAV